MSKYTDIVKEDTPKIVIKFRKDDQGKDQYEWGIKGEMPIVDVIGAILKAQHQLNTISPDRLLLYDDLLCPEKALVIAQEGSRYHLFVHPEVPTYGILGMLCLIRGILEDSIKAQQQVQKSALFGPDGRPIDKRLYN